MKVIIVSDVLDEPYEFESPPGATDTRLDMWAYEVRDKVVAIATAESMRKPAERERRGIISRG